MQWNRDKIFDLFAYRNANGNSGHPFAEYHNPWHSDLEWELQQSYTVKSVYRAALRIKEQARIEHSMARLDRPI